MKPLPKQYDHVEAEPRWQHAWEASKLYAYDANEPRDNTFVIDTPPPTVSGVLHMGHIFSYTQADFIARYQRMRGKTVFYPMGFDDNGLPTERLVEKTRNVRGSSMPRADFVALCRDVVVEAENQFRALFRTTALSVDWSREYQTNSDRVRKLSQESFLDLFEKNEIYRDFRPTYWDWVDQTAIAQAEVENKELPGAMHEIVFTLEDSGFSGQDSGRASESRIPNPDPLIIATTRPELLAACVAVMYHPEDPKAAIYKGKMAVSPVFAVRVPMIADALVERDKGTGLVMCCTFGDDTDKEWQRIHQLPTRPILGLDGKVAVNIAESIQFYSGKNGKHDSAAISEHNSADIILTIAAFGQIEGLKPKQAHVKVLELLQAQGKLVKTTPITHTVKCAERSGTPIEIIPTFQWFVKITDKKAALIARGAECNWYPEFMRVRLNQWIEGLKEDWCISRQRFFGVPFPVWYSKREGEVGKIVLPTRDQLPLDPLVDLPKGYSRDEVEGDKDVMDTWATSSLSPQINADSLTPNGLFPADLRPQAHEIIRTWAFYTIVKAHLHANTIPWKHVMISGWCLAADKSKMSKSKGNVITPEELILGKGSDVVRYWTSTSRLGADTAFSEDLLKIGKKLITKLWNATQFSSIHLQKLTEWPVNVAEDAAQGKITEPLDKWILSRLQKTIATATQEFDRFEYCDARVAIEEFFWKDFCDNYLELVKARAYGEIGGASAVESAHRTLYYCLHTLLRLFAPFIPHITEEISAHLFEHEPSVHARGTWPKASDYPVDELAEKSGMACMSLLNAVRKAKSERNVSIKFPIDKCVIALKSNSISAASCVEFADDLRSAGTIATIEWATAPLSGAHSTDDNAFEILITWGEAPAQSAAS